MEPTSSSKPPLVLSNPDASRANVERVKMSVMTDPVIWNYLMRQVLPHHSAAQCILSTFLHKFYEALRSSPHPPFSSPKPHFDETNESVAAEILSKLNFNDPIVAKPNPKRSPSPRRTAGGSSNTKKQPGPKDSRS